MIITVKQAVGDFIVLKSFKIVLIYKCYDLKRHGALDSDVVIQNSIRN